MEPRPPIPVARLAVEIADEAARSDIESFCDIPVGRAARLVLDRAVQNLQRAHRDNSTGYLGVQKQRNGTFTARVLSRGTRIDSKPFATPAEAHAAYVEIKALFHPFSTLTTGKVSDALRT